MKQNHLEDPVFRHAKREALIIFGAWLAATTYCCAYSYAFGYIRPGRLLTMADVRPIFGVPSWFFGGVIVPWGVCLVFTVWFAGWLMRDDDLGRDRSEELDQDIREGETHG
ncbi:MAG: hypothetical protein NVSMB14_08320 [Isosphaeraceae bacterium]